MSQNEGNADSWVDELLSALRTVYEKKDKASEFPAEEPVIRELVPKLAAAIAPLKLIRPFALGSTATVWEVLDDSMRKRGALKLARPRLGKIDRIVRVLRGEKDTLAESRHQNITPIYLSGEIPVSVGEENYSFPYFLMDYLDDVKDLDEYIAENLASLTADAIISHFRDVALGLSFLHSKGIIHCDLKPGNIVVAPGYPALIADLGYSKHLERIEKQENEFTAVNYTPSFAHPELITKMTRSTDSAANVAEIPRADLRPAYDLFALGRTLQKVLRIIRDSENGRDGWHESVFTPYQWAYLSLIAVRLLDGQVTTFKVDALESDVISGMPPDAMAELKYDSAREAFDDLEKLLNLYDLEAEVPELNLNLSAYIQVPGSRVPLTRRVLRIVDHPLYRRLAQVTQLGFVSLVYPGASHTRFEHSIGTFEKCCEIVRSLWYDQVSCLFRSLFSRADIEALLLAALLHDVGQYPMAHDLAEVENRFAHDRFTESVLYTLTSETGESLADVIDSEWRVTTNDVMAIFKATASSPLRKRFLKSIISGPLDADKLDYIDRDAHHAGVLLGKDIDRGRLFRNLTVCIRTLTDDDGIQRLDVAEVGITEKAVAVAESVWRARFEMFRQLYWHHSVRSMKAMLGFVVRTTLAALDPGRAEAFNVALHRFCLSPLSFGQASPNQLTSETASPVAERAFSVEDTFITNEHDSLIFSYLSPGDDALISFLWPYADNNAKRILQMIRLRRLFKRIAVVSYGGQGDLYESVYNRFRSMRLQGQLRDQELWRAWVQSEIIAKCGLDSQVVAWRQTGNAGIPIVLVDVPLKALADPPREESIWYVPEEHLGRHRRLGVAVHPLSKCEPKIERASFDRSVGKIRILAHPYWQDAIVRTERIRDTIVGILGSSLTADLTDPATDEG